MTNEKLCTKCIRVLPLAAFPWDSWNPAGSYRYSYCFDCERASRDAARVDGRCVNCECRPAATDHRLCEHCITLDREWYNAHRAEGICQDCNDPASAENSAYCDQHREMYRLRSLEHKRRKQGRDAEADNLRDRRERLMAERRTARTWERRKVRPARGYK